MKLLRLITRWFSRKKDKDVYYMLLTQSRYNNEGAVPETYGGFIFATKEDAMRHSIDVEQFNKAYVVMGIVEFKTDMDLTCAILDYTRTEDHPNPTVTFVRKD